MDPQRSAHLHVDRRMFKRSSKTNKQQPAQGNPSTGTANESILVDVASRQKARDQVNTSRAARPDERRQERTTNTPPPALAEHEPLPSTLVGLSWARSGALKHAGIRGGPISRPSRKSQRWLRRLLIFVPLLLALVFGLHALLTASYFQVRHIMVTGTHNEELVAAIRRLHLDGVNIFLADTSADTAKVKVLPPVADATVTRNLPDTLLVHVVERQPVLIWQVGAQQYSVDAEGVLISQVQQPGELPVVSDEHTRDMQGRPFAPGGKIDPGIVQMARQLLEGVPAATGITSFTLRDTIDYGLVLMSADGWQARFGGPDNLDNKIKELAAILQLVRQQGQQLALIDLRFGFYPYYRIKSPGAEP
jgi:cell division septal protein FtsQ